MSTFEQSRGLYNQTHFTIIEIDLPVVEGVCTIGGENGFGTPLSCDQASNATRTYKFTGIDAPINMPESGILRLVKKVSETPAKLNIDKGLASRGTGTITLSDITGKDPNPDAPAVNDTVINQGTYLSKLNARNELTNKLLRIKNYRLEADGTIDLVNGAETRHYIIDSMNPTKTGDWSIKFKDELSKINIGDTVWPLPLEGFLRSDITDSQITFDVDPNVTYLVGDTVRISDELTKVDSVSNIGSPTATITVEGRGSNITYTNTLTKTRNDSHSADDEIFVCEVSDNERIDDFLERVLLDIGVDSSLIPKADWAAEVDEWHPDTRINTIWIESVSTSDILEEVLTNFMIDLWFDPVDREIKISAISAWKQSTSTITEGNEIVFESVSKSKNETIRATRALVVYNKTYLADPDEVTSYSRSSIFKRTELESDALFGEPKTKDFEFTSVIDKDSADLLVNRWVNRFSNPADYTFKTPERKKTFKTGDIVNTSIFSDVGFSGLPNTSNRIQITSIKPNYTNYGRDYTVTGLSYDPVFLEDAEIIIDGNITNINLFTRFAGGPNKAVTMTFIFDGAIGSGNDVTTPTIRAGSFPAGSKLIIILANGAELMAKGGSGGNGSGATWDGETESYLFIPPARNGEKGGTVFDADGVDCDIYLSGATPSANYPNADGYMIAPNGGDGGFDANAADETGGNGGNGGNGRNVGEGGEGRTLTTPLGETHTGSNGEQGDSDRTTSTFGVAGANNNATGGDAGKGIMDSGGTVNLFGATAVRYVNGAGDH